MKKGAWLWIFFLVAFVQANEITLVDTGYDTVIQYQDLSYFTCTDAQFIKSQALCLDNYQIYPVSTAVWNDSCHFSTINLATVPCNQIQLESFIFDAGDRKLTRQVDINKILVEPNHLFETQEWDGGWGSAKDTAVAIWALQNYSDRYTREIDEGMQWLKNNRDNRTKCWQRGRTGSCDDLETAVTLGFLRMSGVLDQYRVISDGQKYIQSLQNYIDDNDWRAEFTVTNDDVFCNITYAESSLDENVEFDEDIVYKYNFDADYGEAFNFTCTDDVTLELYNDKNILLFSEDFDEDTEQDYDYQEDPDVEENEDADERYKIVRITPPCWAYGGSVWNGCHQQLSTYALGLNLDSNREADGKEWLDDSLINDTIVGQYINSDNEVFDAIYYLRLIEDNDNLREWLLYNQNNDGSFGQGSAENRLLATALAVEALEELTFPQKEETLHDARHWISRQYNYITYTSPIANAAIFKILAANQRPIIRIADNQLFSVSQARDITLLNPTPYELTNISFEVISDLTDPITISGPENISANSQKNVTLTNKITQAGTYTVAIDVYGTQEDKRSSQKLHTIFANITTASVLNIDAVNTELYVYDFADQVGLNVKSINSDFTCDVLWNTPIVTSNREISFSSTGRVNLPFTITSPIEQDINAQLQLTCNNGVDELVKTFNFVFHVFETIPFEIPVSDITFTEFQSESTFTIVNLRDRPLTVEITTARDEPLLDIPATVTIQPRFEETVTINHLFTAQENVTVVNTITISADGYSQEVEYTASIIAQPYSFPWWIVYLILLAAIIAPIIIWRKKVMPYLIMALRPIQKYLPPAVQIKIFGENANDPTKHFLNKKQKKANAMYANMMDIITIMKKLDKTDDDIKTRLLKEGYGNQEVSKIMEDVNNVQKQIENIKHEDTVVNIVQTLNAENEVIVKMLSEKGFNEREIRQALKELSEDSQNKDRQLREQAGFNEDDKL